MAKTGKFKCPQCGFTFIGHASMAKEITCLSCDLPLKESTEPEKKSPPMSFKEAAKILGTNFRNCKTEDHKAGRLSDRMRYLGDDGVWTLKDENGHLWKISGYSQEMGE